MNRKKQFMVLMLCVLALAVGLSVAQAQDQRKLSDSPQLQSDGVSFIPSITTHLGYTASLIVDGLSAPGGIGVSPKADRIYINTQADHGIWKYHNQVLKLMQTHPSRPDAARFRGAFYFGDSAGNIYKGEDGTPVQLLTNVPDTFITALDVDQNTGVIYFVAYHPSSVEYVALLKLYPGNSTPVPMCYLPTYSYGLALKGNFIYVTYLASGQIYKISKKGSALNLVKGGLIGPTDIGFDKEGNMIVAEHDNGSIARVKAGSLNIVRIATGLVMPYSLQLDARDNIYFTDIYTGVLWKLKKQ